MPEYLAPGVYIEEIEIGAKPIEGVSTSTAGFLGYAERGPLNKPTLVTSFADFERIFGGFLPASSEDIKNKIRWLAYAVSAFFENGGKRAYVTRVASDQAKAASGFLPRIWDPEPPILCETVSKEESGIKLKGTINFSPEDVILLADGIQSDYFQYMGMAKIVSLKATGAKLAESHAAGLKIWKGEKPTDPTTQINQAVTIGAKKLPLAAVTGIEKDDYLLIQDTTKGIEVVSVEDFEDTAILIKEPLRFEHAKDIEVFKLTTSKETILIQNAKKDDTALIVDSASKLVSDDFIIVGSEYHPIKPPKVSTDIIHISPPLIYTHDYTPDVDKPLNKLVPAVEVTASSEGTWGNSIKVAVKQSSLLSTEVTKVPSTPDRLDLETVTGLEIGSLLKSPAGITPQYVFVKEVHKTATYPFVLLEDDLNGTIEVGDTVQSMEFDLKVTEGTRDEIFTFLSLNESHSRYIKKIVTEKSSDLIRIGDISGTPPVIPMPTPDDLPGWPLYLWEKGNDGFPADDNDLEKIYTGEDSDEPDDRTGLYTFKNVDEISIVTLPGITYRTLQQLLITHCEIEMKDRFAVLDPPETANLDDIKNHRNLFDTSYAALYYPWIYAFNPLEGGYHNVPPSGHVCGVIARTDVERGVHKAPANEKINGAFNLEKLNGKFRVVNKGTQEILNPMGINCIRVFPGRGIRIWGARTISSNSLWKYVNVRRLFLYLEESIEEGTQWVVFEPNDEKLWARVKQTITQFLTRVWRDGALMGTTPEEAFFVKCDRTTMTQDDIDNGRLIVLIGVAPVKPAEFVIFRIAQWAGGSEVTE